MLFNLISEGDIEPESGKITMLGGGYEEIQVYINGEVRRRAKVGVGDNIHLVLTIDEEPCELPMPAALAEALNGDPGAKRAYDELPASRKNNILAYLNSLKRPETVRKNVDRLMARLIGPRARGD